MKNFNEFNAYSYEEILEGIDYLIQKYNKKNELRKESINVPNYKFILNNKIKKLVILSCKLSKLAEIELLIDYYCLECKINENEISICDNKNKIKKSMDIGYIISSLSKTANIKIYENPYDENEVFEMFDMYDEATNTSMYEKKNDNTGYKNYNFNYNQMLPALMEKFDTYTNHETNIIKMTADNLGVTTDELLNIEAFEGITIKEMLKVYSAFKPFYLMIKKITQESNDKIRIINSLLMTLNKTQIIDIILYLIDKEKAKKVLKFLTMDFSKKVDTLYSPFIEVLKDKYVISPSGFYNASIVRNLLQNIHVSKYKNIDFGDFSTNLIYNEMKKKGLDIYKNVKCGGLEMDLVLNIDDKLIFFECKDLILPTSAYELRNSYKQIKKSISQLNKFKDKVLSTNFDFNKKINNVKNKEIELFTVMKNNMFFSYRENNVNVINMALIINYINANKLLSINSKENHLEYNFRNKNTEITGESLLSILKYNSYSSAVRKSTMSIKDYFRVGEYKFNTLRYVLNMDEFYEELKKILKYKEVTN